MWAKDMKGHFTKEDVQMAGKRLKTLSPPVAIRKCKCDPQWEATTLLSAELTNNSNSSEHTARGSLTHCQWECKMCGSSGKWPGSFLKKKKTRPNPATITTQHLFWAFIPRDGDGLMWHPIRKHSVQLYSWASPNWKHPRRPPTGDWLNELWPCGLLLSNKKMPRNELVIDTHQEDSGRISKGLHWGKKGSLQRLHTIWFHI